MTDLLWTLGLAVPESVPTVRVLYMNRLNSHAVQETSRRSCTAICRYIFVLLRFELYIVAKPKGDDILP